ncbi:MAG: response regulator [Planctomycetes bacterium]|nr:response regulator [Planctomycetota bacterium]MBI3846577.1 response regulator [Planctomycetota bacterium]
MNAQFFDIALTRRGNYATYITESVPEILDRARLGEVDLVVMDVSLANSSYEGKRMDGLGIARLLKTDPRTSHIPILLATAHAMKGDRESFLKQSMADDYASKPITNPQELIDKVKALLARRDGESTK